MSIRWTLTLLTFYFSAGELNNFSVPPSYGDIVLQDETLNLYISMAPDGVELNDYLFPVCGTYFSIHKNAITNVVSRQLGYATCYLEFPDVGDHPSFPFFGHEMMKCRGDEYHILRCQNLSYTNTCSKYIKVNCNTEKLFNDSIKAYPGQVVLVPPRRPNLLKSVKHLTATASLGLVAVKEEGENCQYLRYLMTTEKRVSLDLANTLCLQMGFTHADPSSVLSRRDAEKVFNLSFSYWDYKIQGPLIQVSSINCGGKSHECLGCCSYTPYPFCLNTQISDSDRDHLLVLRCSFYLNDRPIQQGGSLTCKFEDNETQSTCGSDNSTPSAATTSSSKCYAGLITLSAGFGVVLVFLIAVILVFLNLKHNNRCPYRIVIEFYKRHKDPEDP